MKRKTTILSQTLCLLLLVVLLLQGGGFSATAQSNTIDWARPTNLSNTPQASAHPAIVADDYGYVHVFWSEEMGGRPMQPEENIRNTGNTIFYTRWDGVSWTPPIDILFVPGEFLAEWPVVTLDPENRLHVVWTSMSNLYYSNALAWEADSAHAWSEPEALTNNSASVSWGASIIADDAGTLHVVYATRDDEAGIYYTRSTDSGASWQVPARLSDPFAPLEEHLSTIKIITDAAGRLHAAWETHRADGVGQAVYYARSTDGGDTWSAPVQLAIHDPEDFVVGVPYLVARGESEIHLIYVDGPVIGSRGRYHRVSQDGGETWSPPYHIITDLMGMNGYVGPVIDGAGQMHLVINMRTVDTQITGIYYARWLGTGWSQVEPVDVSIRSAHYPAFTIRQGNELHVVYTQLTGGEIWHIRGTIPSVDQTPVLTLPSPGAPTPLPEPTEVILPTPTFTPTPGIQPTREPTPTQSSSGPIHPLVPAVGAALLLVGGIVAWSRIRS